MLDANGTRHHLVLGRPDWMRLGAPDGLPISGSPPTGGGPPAFDGPAPDTGFDRTGTELTLAPLPMIAAPWPPGQAPGQADRRGAGVDANGNIYRIDPDETAIVVTPAGGMSEVTFWSQAPALESRAAPGEFAPSAAAPTTATPATLRGLTVTSEEYLVVATVEPPGLLMFDLRAPGPPRRMQWPRSLPWSPLALVATADGGLLLLDASEAPRYWRFDRLFDVVSERSQPPASPPPGAFVPAPPAPSEPASTINPPPGPDYGAAIAGRPVAIASLPSGTVLVLTRADEGSGSALQVYVDDAPTGVALALGADESGEAVDAFDMVLGPSVPGDSADVVGHLYVVSAARAQAFDFSVTEAGGRVTIRMAPRHLPLRGFSGVELALAVTGPLYHSGARWVPLAAQPQSSYAPRATLRLGPFDGREPGCTWHRLTLDGALPSRCTVSVFSRAADDDKASLANAPFMAEPAPKIRPFGSEQPYVTLPDGYCTAETLFQEARGRYLELKLVLTGDHRTTPRLRAVRVYYPRFSYLHRYLPAVYRANAPSASFLDRYLANVEGINTTLEDLIANAQAMFDPRSAPAGALDWLAAFFDVALDPAWTDDKRRLFIARAMDFFAWRGTVRGLQVALRLALDPAVDQRLFDDPADARTLKYRVVELFADPTAAISSGERARGSGPRVLPGPRPLPVQPPPGSSSAAAARDTAQWTQFLALRYRRLSALNQAYNRAGDPYGSFAEVPLPATEPHNGPQRADWLDFTTVVARTAGQAHRFIVLVPVPLAAAGDPTDIDPGGFRALAERIVELNKPVHTMCEIRYYWTAFQVGTGRLGTGTAIHVGSRAPQLRVPAQLGRDYTGDSYLGGPTAPYLTHGRTVGRGATLDTSIGEPE